MIVKNKNPVPYNYTPYENAEAGNQVRNLIKEMQNSGYNISNSYSGYRSFNTQAGLYQNYVNNYGQSEADTFSARAVNIPLRRSQSFRLESQYQSVNESHPSVIKSPPSFDER